MIPQDFSKIIELACSGHGLTTLCILLSLKDFIAYVIPNGDWELLCMCVHTYIYTQTHTSLPPLNVLIILFDIKKCSLSINISFPSEFRISRISDSNLFFLGFIPLYSYTKYCYVLWKFRPCTQDTCTFLSF